MFFTVFKGRGASVAGVTYGGFRWSKGKSSVYIPYRDHLLLFLFDFQKGILKNDW